MLLLVVEDRHAERELRLALAAARARGEQAIVLTGDALLAMRLRREGVNARLTIHRLSTDAKDGRDPRAMADRDRVALDGVAAAFGRYADAGGRDLGPYLQYTLIPIFIRAVRNVTAVDDVLNETRGSDPKSGSDPVTVYSRIVLIGGGPLVDAARLVAAHRGVATEVAGGDWLKRAAQAIARMRAGRATRWVNTELRPLVLEPGFIWLLFFKGLWHRLTGRPLPQPRQRGLIIVGDRFTADVIQLVRGESRPIVLAGATQPGRALFDARSHGAGLIPIEDFTRLADPLRWVGAKIDALAHAVALAGDAAHARQFTVDGVRYWPLVGRTVWLHIVVWIPTLRHLQTLAARAAHAHPDAQLLTSSDVTAYNRVLIDTARAFGATTIGIQHGITGEPNGHDVVRVDTLAVWGTATEPWYRVHNPLQTARFTITGNPRFDALALRQAQGEPPTEAVSPPASAPAEPVGATARLAEAREARRRQPFAFFTVTVCTGFTSDFSTGASEYENLLTLDAVLAWAKARDDVRVIHKIHPGEEIAYYAEAARALGWDPRKLTTIREPILHDVLETSDVLVAAYSTTVLESLILGTPAIVVDAVVQRRLLALDRVPGITIAYTIDELHQQLDARRAAPAPDRQALRSSAELGEYISGLDGRATERVAALLEQERERV
jgi:hypothetical protein